MGLFKLFERADVSCERDVYAITGCSAIYQATIHSTVKLPSRDQTSRVAVPVTDLVFAECWNLMLCVRT